MAQVLWRSVSDITAEDDAKELLTFIEMLLKFIFEFPGRVPTLDPAADST